MKSFEQFADLMGRHTEEEWRAQVFKIAHDLGYKQTLLAIFPHRNSPIEARFAFLQSNFSADWCKKYDTEKMGRFDPAVTHCMNKSIPLILSPEIFSTQEQKQIYEEASSYGIRSGVTLPIHGAKGELGILHFANDTKPGKHAQQETSQHLPELSCFRDFIFETAVRFMQSSRPAEPTSPLSPRELECLKWSLAGKSYWAIAQILHCSEAAVNFHFNNIRRKFKTATRQEAVIRALRLGLIYPA